MNPDSSLDELEAKMEKYIAILQEYNAKFDLINTDVFSNVTKKEPKILRFVVNGYDLLATCKV